MSTTTLSQSTLTADNTKGLISLGWNTNGLEVDGLAFDNAAFSITNQGDVSFEASGSINIKLGPVSGALKQIATLKLSLGNWSTSFTLEASFRLDISKGQASLQVSSATANFGDQSISIDTFSLTFLASDLENVGKHLENEITKNHLPAFTDYFNATIGGNIGKWAQLVNQGLVSIPSGGASVSFSLTSSIPIKLKGIGLPLGKAQITPTVSGHLAVSATSINLTYTLTANKIDNPQSLTLDSSKSFTDIPSLVQTAVEDDAANALHQSLKTFGDYYDAIDKGWITPSFPQKLSFPLDIYTWDVDIPDLHLDLGHINLTDTFSGTMSLQQAKGELGRIESAIKKLEAKKETYVYHGLVAANVETAEAAENRTPTFSLNQPGGSALRTNEPSIKSKILKRLENSTSKRSLLSGFTLNRATPSYAYLEAHPLGRWPLFLGNRISFVVSYDNHQEVNFNRGVCDKRIAVLNKRKVQIQNEATECFLSGELKVLSSKFTLNAGHAIPSNLALNGLDGFILNELQSTVSQYLTVGTLAQLIKDKKVPSEDGTVSIGINSFKWTVSEIPVSGIFNPGLGVVLHEVTPHATGFKGTLTQIDGSTEAEDTLSVGGTFQLLGETIKLEAFSLKPETDLSSLYQAIATQAASQLGSKWFNTADRFMALFKAGSVPFNKITTNSLSLNLDFQASLSHVNSSLGNVVVKGSFKGSLSIDSYNASTHTMRCTIKGSVSAVERFNLNFWVDCKPQANLGDAVAAQIASETAAGHCYGDLYNNAQHFLESVKNKHLIDCNLSGYLSHLGYADWAIKIILDAFPGKIITDPKKPGPSPGPGGNGGGGIFHKHGGPGGGGLPKP